MKLTFKVRRLVLREPCPVGFFGKLRWRFLWQRQSVLDLPDVDDRDRGAINQSASTDNPGWTVVSSEDLPGTKELEAENGERRTPNCGVS
jgi:hypothetical protein